MIYRRTHVIITSGCNHLNVCTVYILYLFILGPVSSSPSLLYMTDVKSCTV